MDDDDYDSTVLIKPQDQTISEAALYSGTRQHYEATEDWQQEVAICFVVLGVCPQQVKKIKNDVEMSKVFALYADKIEANEGHSRAWHEAVELSMQCEFTKPGEYGSAIIGEYDADWAVARQANFYVADAQDVDGDMHQHNTGVVLHINVNDMMPRDVQKKEIADGIQDFFDCIRADQKIMQCFALNGDDTTQTIAQIKQNIQSATWEP